MNLRYLGDAFDHWKGSLFECLAGSGVLRAFVTDPMASDLYEWTEADYSVYARLLRIDVSLIIRHHVTLNDRPGYFREIAHNGDLFLDPDTGVATGRVQNRHQYLYPREIRMLLDGSNDRLLMVYQHVRAQNVSRRVDDCLLHLKRDVGKIESRLTPKGEIGNKGGSLSNRLRAVVG